MPGSWYILIISSVVVSKSSCHVPIQKNLETCHCPTAPKGPQGSPLRSPPAAARPPPPPGSAPRSPQAPAGSPREPRATASGWRHPWWCLRCYAPSKPSPCRGCATGNGTAKGWHVGSGSMPYGSKLYLRRYLTPQIIPQTLPKKVLGSIGMG